VLFEFVFEEVLNIVFKVYDIPTMKIRVNFLALKNLYIAFSKFEIASEA